MDLELGDDHRQVRDVARDRVDTRVVPYAAARAQPHRQEIS
ncbi:hypothetical protein [Nocardia aurantia]|uniref:Uncharacterized protein n=1 Tax=Nocardia aurantia TaxID=2585199 RepID=A0A7K0DJ67_9NOCA|nr:hypothetical protein [Nocardia aurantia]MQY25611.1 hypothetical protein [Nocardia aurantia]